MWKCPACGEEIDDRFDSCWKCAKDKSIQPVDAPSEPSSIFESFWRAWCRGWFVLLMMLVYGIFSGFMQAILRGATGFFALIELIVALLLIPASAYWVFVLFFGDDVSWPFQARRETSPEKSAAELLDDATKLEAYGDVKRALRIYEIIATRFRGTVAGQDAQKSLESLRAKIGQDTAASATR